MRGPCLKQTTRCVITRADGTTFEATNTCDVPYDVNICPRVTMGSPTGQGYDLCLSLHAEHNVAELAAATSDVPGVATLYGHDWFCRDCQHALVAVGVRTFQITGEPA